jgi:SAM-dependent methyltransferase
MEGEQAWRSRARLSLPTARVLRPNLEVARYLFRLPATLANSEPRCRVDDWRWWRSRHRPYLEAFVDLNLPVTGSLLDLGCGDGLVTCFYAAHYPRAQVIGLDYCPTCLLNTHHLARRLALRNVTVIEGNTLDLGSLFHNYHFDLIIARCVFHRLFHLEQDDRTQQADARSVLTEISRAIHQRLTPHGHFVSVEGWRTAAELRAWTVMLSAIHFEVDWRRSRLLPAGSSRYSTLLVTRKAETAIDGVERGVIQFFASSELARFTGPIVLRGYLAAAVLDSLQPKTSVYAFTVTSLNGAAWRRQLWSRGQLLLTHDSTTWDDHEVTFWPGSVEIPLRSQLEREAKLLKIRGHNVTVDLPLLPDRITLDANAAQ